MRRTALFLLLAATAPRAAAQDEYGARGLFPVYRSGIQWLVYDKPRKGSSAAELGPGADFLVIGNEGAGMFVVARSSPTYGGVCKGGKPLRLRAALLKGTRTGVGEPVLAIKVPEGFKLKGSRAVFKALEAAYTEPFYRGLGPALNAAVIEEAKSGAFKFPDDDAEAQTFLADPRPEKVLLKIDFAAKLPVAGLKDAAVLVTEAQISGSFRRCLRLADGDKLVGGCVEMPRQLMVETAQLRFVSYDPSGKGNPYLLAYSRPDNEPLWGHERWGFALRANGARLFLRDAMDPRCRAAF